MCDYGRLNYKWINREDRLTRVQMRNAAGALVTTDWEAAFAGISEKLRGAANGSVGLVASARLSNEELYLAAHFARRYDAVTDAVPRNGQGDRLLLSADRNPNSNGARLLGIAAEPMGSRLPRLADSVRNGSVKFLLVFGEDVTRHGLGPDLLAKLELLVVCDILPNAAAERAHFVLPGCAHVEKRGTFINGKGRVQKFMKAIEPRGDARPEWEILRELNARLIGPGQPATIEGLFNRLAAETPAFSGATWAGLGDTGASVPI
jgi:NADH-quinone oxidoreductase subunit G